MKYHKSYVVLLNTYQFWFFRFNNSFFFLSFSSLFKRYSDSFSLEIILTSRGLFSLFSDPVLFLLENIFVDLFSTFGVSIFSLLERKKLKIIQKIIINAQNKIVEIRYLFHLYFSIILSSFLGIYQNLSLISSYEYILSKLKIFH